VFRETRFFRNLGSFTKLRNSRNSSLIFAKHENRFVASFAKFSRNEISSKTLGKGSKHMYIYYWGFNWINQHLHWSGYTYLTMIWLVDFAFWASVRSSPWKLSFEYAVYIIQVHVWVQWYLQLYSVGVNVSCLVGGVYMCAWLSWSWVSWFVCRAVYAGCAHVCVFENSYRTEFSKWLKKGELTFFYLFWTIQGLVISDC
jgi:hypothetical protein